MGQFPWRPVPSVLAGKCGQGRVVGRRWPRAAASSRNRFSLVWGEENQAETATSCWAGSAGVATVATSSLTQRGSRRALPISETRPQICGERVARTGPAGCAPRLRARTADPRAAGVFVGGPTRAGRQDPTNANAVPGIAGDRVGTALATPERDPDQASGWARRRRVSRVAPKPRSAMPATNGQGPLPVFGTLPEAEEDEAGVLEAAAVELLVDELVLLLVEDACATVPVAPTVKSRKPNGLGVAVPPPSPASKPMAVGCTTDSVTVGPAWYHVVPLVE